jgi:VWFA-related protein
MDERHHLGAGRAIAALVLAAAAVSLVGPGARVLARQTQSPPAQPPPAAQAPAAPAQPPAAGSQTQPQDQQQQPPRIRTGINYVRVDAIVTDRQGNPVLDLKQDEFRIKEDGKAQSIESFSVVKIDALEQLDGPPAREPTSIYEEQREAQRPDVRLFIILLDDYHVRRGNDMVVRKPLIEFIENQLAPADMVAIMYPLTPITGLSFTRNRGRLISAIEHFQGRRFDYRPMNQFEEQYANYPAQTVEMIRNQVVMTALKGAAIKLGGMREGRKSIIFVSEGFTGLLPPQLNDPVASMPGFGNAARGNSGVQNSDRAEWAAQVDMISDLNLIFTEMNRNNTSIYAVDPRGLAPFEYDINQAVGLQVDKKHLDASLDTLRALADNTDGRAIVNRNDIGKAMQQIIRDASGYYLIGYNSSQAPTDGKFHKIDVEVTRKGVDVRARKGYWAYTADDVARAEAAKVEAPPAVTAALATLAEPPRGRPARFWIGTGRAENGKSSVTFAWEPVAPLAGERRGPDDNASNVLLTVVAPDGRPLFRGRVPEQGAAVAPAAAPGAAAPASATFAVPPGRVQMRITVQNAGGQVVDSATNELLVPDYTAPQVSLGTPRVFRARTPREVQALKANPGAVPTADRAFSRSERLFVRVDAYGPGTASPGIAARLLNRAGTGVLDVPVQASGPTGELELALASLAAGEYLLELNAKSEAGSAQQLVAFRVR